MTIKEKILRGIQLTEGEIRSIYYEDEVGIDVVSTIQDRKHGYRTAKLILVIEGRYFSILVYEGVYQTDYPEQIAEEVEPIVWVKKQQGNNYD